ncbi:MAG: hypothetical protein AAF251_17070 [Pseudomonadota bacterium]
MASPALAQERVPIDLGPDAETQGKGPPQQLDILIEPAASDAPTAAQQLECEDEIDAEQIAGEIVVCRRIVDPADRFSGSYADWLKDYAERTQGVGAPAAPDVDGTGLPPGMAAVVTINGCFIPPCPKPPALIIDVEALPSAPVGTDADRLAQGLAPRRVGSEYTPDERRRLEAEMGLPPKPDFDETEEGEGR